jgi:hypothetical protein
LSLQTGVLNFALFTKLPSLHLPLYFRRDAVSTPFAAGHAPSSPAKPASSHSRFLLDVSRPRHVAPSPSAHAEVGRAKRHSDDVPSRPTCASSLCPALLPPICFTSKPPASTSTPLPAPSARPSFPRRLEPPPPPWLPWSPLLRPSSRPTDPAASFPALHRCSPTRSPSPTTAGRSPPPLAATAGRCSPRRRPFRPPQPQSSPPLGSSRSPLASPPPGPRRR